MKENLRNTSYEVLHFSYYWTNPVNKKQSDMSSTADNTHRLTEKVDTLLIIVPTKKNVFLLVCFCLKKTQRDIWYILRAVFVGAKSPELRDTDRNAEMVVLDQGNKLLKSLFSQQFIILVLKLPLVVKQGDGPHSDHHLFYLEWCHHFSILMSI